MFTATVDCYSDAIIQECNRVGNMYEGIDKTEMSLSWTLKEVVISSVHEEMALLRRRGFA